LISLLMDDNLDSSKTFMALVRMGEKGTIRCTKCNTIFTEETAAAVHELTHEVFNLRMVLDQRLETLDRIARSLVAQK
jgi:hypothetical protein